SLGAAAMTALTFGLAPAVHATRTNLVEALKNSGSGGGGFRRGKFQGALVIVEVALSLVLLSGAGLLLRSFAKIQAQAPGLDTGHLLYAPLTLPRGFYDTAAAKRKFFRTLLPRLETLPGVVAVSAGTSLLPLRSLDSPVEIRGQVTAEIRHARYDLCSENYFATLGLHRLRGRLLDAAEIDAARPVAVVNESFARRFFAAGDPIGQQVRLARGAGAGSGAWFEIVGVIADFRNDGVVAPPAPEIFLPYTVTAE